MKKHLKSGIWLLIEKSLKVFSGILVTAAVARYLGPEQYGVLALALGTVAVFTAATSMGAEHINTSELAKQKDKANQFLVSAVMARLFWAVICLSAYAVFIKLTDKTSNLVYLYVATMIPIAAFSVVGNKLQANGQFNKYAQLSCISIIFCAIIKIIAIKLHADIHLFALISVFEVGLTLLLIWVYLERIDNGLLSAKPKMEIARYYFALCLPTAFSAVLVALYLRLELFMVGTLLGEKNAGLWASVMMFMSPWGMVASSILPIANRHLASNEHNREDYEIKIIRLIRFMLALSIFAVLANLFFAEFMLPVLLGDAYEPAISLIKMASLAIIPLYMGSVQEIWIAHQKKTKIVLKKVVLGLPISGFLLFFLGEKYGISGAAMAMVVSYFTSSILMNAIFDKEFLKLQMRAMGI